MSERKQFKIGLAGIGYFGKIILKTLNKMGCGPDYAYDPQYPHSPYGGNFLGGNGDKLTNLCKTYADLLEPSRTDIIFIATPACSHFELAKAALLADKHVFLEKPMTLVSQESRELVNLAAERSLYLHVDNTFVYSKEVNFLKYFVDFNLLGDPIRYSSNRSNYGPFRKDIDVVFDLMCHDLSIIDYLFPAYKLDTAVGFGQDVVNKGVLDHAVAQLEFCKFGQSRLTCNLESSWRSPTKIRDISIEFEGGRVASCGGSDGTIEVYDCKNNLLNTIVAQNIFSGGDALTVEITHFLNCISTKTPTLSMPWKAADVVYHLEMIKKSILTKREVQDVPF